MARARSICLLAASCVVTCTAILVLAPGLAAAQTEPEIDGTWVSRVTATSANLRAEINPGGLSTSYYFEYLTKAEYAANGEAFAGASKAPASGAAFLGYGDQILFAFQHVSLLASGTSYVYRITATNSAGTAVGKVRVFTTESSSPSTLLADSRAWEMVSPVDKNGGSIQPPGGNAGGGVLQAAAQGGAITYSSASSFGEAPEGAPPASQYISRWSAGGWLTENITTPAVSGSFGTEPRGVPYQLFSPGLADGLVLNGEPCRGEGSGCPVDNPPLQGTEAPAGYQNYYLRNDESGVFTALLTYSNTTDLMLPPGSFHLHFAGASPDLSHVVLSTCAKLTANAMEVPGSEGCEPSATNLYIWFAGHLELINVAPGAALAAQRGAISTDGSHVYFTEGGKLYLRNGAAIELVAEGPELEFQAATPDGSAAFYIKEGHLYRYDVAAHGSSDLTPSGGVIGVLGISEDGSHVYYEDGSGIGLLDGTSSATIVAVPEAARPSDFLAGTAAGAGRGTARVSPDGSRLVFVSTESEALNDYDNTDEASPEACGLPQGTCDPEVYLYQQPSAELTCISCNPTGSRPLGPSTIPGATANGIEEGSTEAYEPRALSADGRRLFFESADALLPADTNKRPDVYEWEAEGEGSCTSSGGCLSLVSSGRGEDGASFVDASAEGGDAFILTDQSLVRRDPGSSDIYDARVDGVNSEPTEGELCLSDECAPLPAAPEEPTVGTLTPGPSNPPLVPAERCPKSKHRVIRHGKITCVANHKKHRRRETQRHRRLHHTRTHRLRRAAK